MILTTLLLLVALACGIVLAIYAITRRSVEGGLGAAAIIALAWAGLLLVGLHL